MIKTIPLSIDATPEDKPLTVLFADDDYDDRIFFKEAITQIPISIDLTIVNDGEQVMEHITAHYKNLPDVLFLDLSMPRKTGFEVLIEIKEDNRFKALPVIVLTTSLIKGIEFELKLSNTLIGIGALDYIRKPQDINKLKPLIHLALIKVIEHSGLNTTEKKNP